MTAATSVINTTHAIPVTNASQPTNQVVGDHANTAANVDQAELAKFADIAHRWWDAHGDFKPLHDINPLRLGWIERHLNGFSGVQIIDVGCGGGLLSEGMAAAGANVVGIDLGEKALNVARLHQLESGLSVNYRLISVENLAAEMSAATPPQQVDAVTCLEMLEHVPDPAGIIAAAAQLVKPGGLLFFSTLNRHVKAYLLAVIGAEYLLGWLPKGTHDYEKFIRPSELMNWARAANLELVDLVGMSYHPLSRTYTLSNDTSVNYLCCLRKN